MRPPVFAHLTGDTMWRHCDHQRTVVASNPTRVMLAPADAAATKTEVADPTAWLAVRGAAASIPCPPDLCADAQLVLADPRAGLFALGPDGWRPLPPPRARSAAQDAAGGLSFHAGEPPADPPPPAAIARDPSGRIWLLDRAAKRLRVLAPDFALVDTQALPQANDPAQVAAASWGVAVSDDANLMVQTYGSRWRKVTLDAPITAMASCPTQDFVALLLPGPRLGVLRRDALRINPLPESAAPPFIVVTGKNAVLIGTPHGAPGGTAESRFIRYTLSAEDVPAGDGFYAVRGFDGRALWAMPDGVYASTAAGSRALYARSAPLVGDGIVETYALDSTIFACVWHRVFVDVCLPTGASVTLEAKTTDDLPPRDAVRLPSPPANVGGPPSADPSWPYLLSAVADEPGWQPVGELDARGPMADIPDPPHRIARPSEDPLGPERSKAPAHWTQQTLEGLIKSPPGRYLALRLRLTGGSRVSPAVLAVRASYPRPSLLEHLPSYWRAEPATADATDRALALFEGFVTETDARITALRELADPRLVPPEALDWLASYVALAFNQRVGEPVRRQLLSEIATLYRRRGTSPGLTRLLSILAQAPVTLVETFKLRRQSAVYLNNSAAIVGPGLQLGDDDGTGPPQDPADLALQNTYDALMLRRAAIRAAGGVPCPPDDPPEPIETDPLARFVRRFAHRFTVVVPLSRDATLEGVLQDAIEANKPAHTLHALCWLDAGFRLARSSYVGFARLGKTACFEPGVLGTAVLGAENTVGAYDPDPRFRPGQRLTTDPFSRGRQGHERHH